jgi:hypothetical protein
MEYLFDGVLVNRLSSFHSMNANNTSLYLFLFYTPVSDRGL